MRASNRRIRILMLVGLLLMLITVLLSAIAWKVWLNPSFNVYPALGTRLKDDTLHVLFIGNSLVFANDLPEMLRQLAAAAPKDAPEDRALEIQEVTRGGTSLAEHWESGVALQVIQANRFDYVVLQEQSARAVREWPALRDAARKFDAEIQKSGGKTTLYIPLGRTDMGEEYSQELWTEAYVAVSRELKSLIVPAGVAAQSALRQRPELPLMAPDGIHPNAAGTYLVACTFFSSLLQKSPEGLLARIVAPGQSQPLVDLPEADARFLQQQAWEAVQGVDSLMAAPTIPTHLEGSAMMALLLVQEGRDAEGIALLNRYIEQGGQKADKARQLVKMLEDGTLKHN